MNQGSVDVLSPYGLGLYKKTSVRYFSVKTSSSVIKGLITRMIGRWFCHYCMTTNHVANLASRAENSAWLKKGFRFICDRTVVVDDCAFNIGRFVLLRFYKDLKRVVKYFSIMQRNCLQRWLLHSYYKVKLNHWFNLNLNIQWNHLHDD